MDQSNLDANQINVVNEDDRSYTCDMDDYESYINVLYYLKHMEAPSHLNDNEMRFVNLQAIRFIIISGNLWLRNFDEILLTCIDHK